jgi:hypothetical protein
MNEADAASLMTSSSRTNLIVSSNSSANASSIETSASSTNTSLLSISPGETSPSPASQQPTTNSLADHLEQPEFKFSAETLLPSVVHLTDRPAAHTSFKKMIVRDHNADTSSSNNNSENIHHGNSSNTSDMSPSSITLTNCSLDAVKADSAGLITIANATSEATAGKKKPYEKKFKSNKINSFLNENTNNMNNNHNNNNGHAVEMMMMMRGAGTGCGSENENHVKMSQDKKTTTTSSTGARKYHKTKKASSIKLNQLGENCMLQQQHQMLQQHTSSLGGQNTNENSLMDEMGSYNNNTNANNNSSKLDSSVVSNMNEDSLNNSSMILNSIFFC